MPQRAKTPPPPQEEIFLTVHYPYPQHANMEMEEDVERVAQWLGSIVKPAYFNAFYHKPSARNTVIIEVKKAIGDDKRKLLGQHIWKDILIKPTDGEKEHRSGIFYCVYSTIRDVQKEGWKRIDFEDTWFMPKNREYTSIHYDQAEWERMVEKEGVFSIPYPLSSRCEVPMEDPTNRGFCRPLPVELFPIPVRPEMPREVPGTLKWAMVKALPESAWAKTPPKAIKGKSGSQATTQPKDQRGRTAAPRNITVGPPVAAINSGVNHKSPGSLPPNLVINDKGKGKQKETNGQSNAADELAARTLSMELNGEEEDQEYQEYYGAGMGDVLASAGVATSPPVPVPDHDPIDHNGVGVHVSGVTIKTVVVEDSLWGDPLEKMNKKLKKEDDVPLCDFHGKICSKGICQVYEKQLREYQKKQKDLQGPQNRRNGNGDQYNGRGGTRGRGLGQRGRGSLLLRSAEPGKDFGPRSPTNDWAPRRPNGAPPPRAAPSRPNGNPRVNGNPKVNDNPKVNNNNAWGANNNEWSKSEMGGSSKPVDKPIPNGSAEGDNGDTDRPLNSPAAQDWSQSEIGGGSQGDPWAGPGKAGGKSNGTRDDPWAGPGKAGGKSNGTRGDPWAGPGNAGGKPSGTQGDPWGGPGKGKGKPNGTKNGPGGTRGQNPVQPGWGDSNGAGGGKDWSPSELGVGDSVSQRGDDGFRNAPSTNAGKKSWADQVEDGDEMEYTNGDEPAPMVAPEPNLEAEDEEEDGWAKRGKGRGKGKGKGKAKSATGWSDVTSKGPW